MKARVFAVVFLLAIPVSAQHLEQDVPNVSTPTPPTFVEPRPTGASREQLRAVEAYLSALRERLEKMDRESEAADDEISKSERIEDSASN